jgi:hypothetical protein
MMTPPSDMPAPPRRRTWWHACGCVGISVFAFAVVCVIPPLGWFVIPLASHIWATVGTQTDFSRNEAYYVRIVELIQDDDIKPEVGAIYVVPEGWNRESLTRADQETLLKWHQDPGKKGRAVSAWRDKTGALVVTFTTYDLGHMGSHGLLYSSADLTKSQAEDKLTNCGDVTPLKRGWWAFTRGD